MKAFSQNMTISAAAMLMLVFGTSYTAESLASSSSATLASQSSPSTGSPTNPDSNNDPHNSLVQSISENYQFSDDKDRQTFLKLTAELRCPKCQNQNIADSDAMIAHDMRRKVYQLMQQGNEEGQVIDYMKQRYGDFVYYQPPLTPVTIWLWALPVLFAFIMAWVFIRRRKPAPEQDIKAKLAAADALLAQKK